VRVEPAPEADAPVGSALGAPLPMPEELGQTRVHVPVDVRSLSLAVLALLASIFALHWARAVFIPLLLGIVLAYALWPLVDRLERWRLPRALGAAVVLLGILGGLGATGWALADDATELMESLPEAATKLRKSLSQQRSDTAGPIDQVQKAAAQLEQAAAEASASPAPRGVMRVQVEQPRFNLKNYFWSGTLGLAAFVAQSAVVVFLVYFLLVSGKSFRRKIVKIAGHTLTEKKITVQALDEINQQIRTYLLVNLFTSVLVGVATWLAFWALGLQHAAVWGVVSAVLNLVPYLGSLAVTVVAALVAFLQFGTLEMAAAVGGVSLLINTLEGQLLMPWLTSRASRMNPVAVFIGVLAFGWLWGVWGMLLGVPILMVVKTVCDRVDDLKPVGELLSA
jgi:predicted PurR-regulated permease PerM